MKDKGYFGNFEPKEVFLWLDGPRTFSLLDQDGQLCFAHWLQEVEDLWQFVVVPVTENILKELKNGELSLRDVLQQPRIYVVAVASDATVQSITLTSWEDLPQEALPEPGTMIRKDLEPFFRLNIPKRFEESGTIIDILGEDAELCVEFKTDASTIQRDCKFSDELWEVYGEKLHFNQSIRVYGVVSTSKEPITVLEVGFPDETGESAGDTQ